MERELIRVGSLKEVETSVLGVLLHVDIVAGHLGEDAAVIQQLILVAVLEVGKPETNVIIVVRALGVDLHVHDFFVSHVLEGWHTAVGVTNIELEFL